MCVCVLGGGGAGEAGGSGKGVAGGSGKGGAEGRGSGKGYPDRLAINSMTVAVCLIVGALCK